MQASEIRPGDRIRITYAVEVTVKSIFRSGIGGETTAVRDNFGVRHPLEGRTFELVERPSPAWQDGDVYLFKGAPRVRETRDGKSGWYDLAGRRCQTADPDEDFFADVPGALPVIAVVRGGKRVAQ